MQKSPSLITAADSLFKPLQSIGQFLPSFESIVQSMPMDEMIREKVVVRLMERSPDKDPLQFAMTRWPSTLNKVSVDQRVQIVQRNSGKNAEEWNDCFLTEFKLRIAALNDGKGACAEWLPFACPSPAFQHNDDWPVFFIKNSTKYFVI